MADMSRAGSRNWPVEKMYDTPIHEVAALRRRVQELEGLVAELADEVEASVRQEWWCVGGEIHPANVRQFERDMELPRRARRALEQKT